jgi:signal peptidase I
MTGSGPGTPGPEPRKKSAKPGWRENVALILEVLVLVSFINAFILQAFGIPTASMEDRMLVGDRILADRVAYSRSLSTLDAILLPQLEIGRGMIIAFRSPPEIRAKNYARLHYVKRVIGLPGELVRVADNVVSINGEPIEEPYKNLSAPAAISPDFPPAPGEEWPQEFPAEYRDAVVDTPGGPAYRVPAGHYFCMGDNRNVSADSRIWGPVPADCIAGKPWRNYWSTKTTTDEMLNPNILAKIKNTVVGLFTRTRWDRFLKKF